jgi:hypothetical protein
MDLRTAQTLIHDIQRQGILVYTLRQGGAHEKGWITINSHYSTHTALNTERFGVPR